MKQPHLIPYKIENVRDTIPETVPQGIKMIRATETWDDSKRGSGIIVGVLDTGCMNDHPDLKNCIVGGKNFTPEGAPDDWTDNNGHGTHVAGTIAAVINGQGVVGVAPEAKLYILKVLQKDGSGSTAGIIAAIRHVIEWNKTNTNKIRVLNMSLGSSESDYDLRQAIQEAVKGDIAIICAAGNEGDIFSGGDCSDQNDEYGYPALFPEVISVGAVDLKGNFPCFSNTNLEIDLVAPGVDILSTFPDENDFTKPSYAVLSGTSMAAPHVSGAAALIIKQCETDLERPLTETEIYAQLIKRTKLLGFGRKREGNGLIDLTVGYQPMSEVQTARETALV